MNVGLKDVWVIELRWSVANLNLNDSLPLHWSLPSWDVLYPDG